MRPGPAGHHRKEARLHWRHGQAHLEVHQGQETSVRARSNLDQAGPKVGQAHGRGRERNEGFRNDEVCQAALFSDVNSLPMIVNSI